MKSSFRSRRKGSSGQALVEYILVLSITIIIIATLVQRLYRPMDNFVRNIMGTYVACLLETGELPQLGADTSGEAESECRIDLFADGAEYPEYGEGEEEDSDKAEEEVTEAPAGKRSGGGYAGRGGVRQSFALGGGRRRGTMGAEKIVLKGEEGAAKIGGSSDYFGSSGRGGGNRRRDRYVAITGMVAEEVAKKNKEKEKGKIVVPKEAGLDVAGSPKKISLKPPERKDRDVASEDIKSLDISQIIKIILIAGIILIMVILIGGQILSLSKSWEKGE